LKLGEPRDGNSGYPGGSGDEHQVRLAVQSYRAEPIGAEVARLMTGGGGGGGSVARSAHQGADWGSWCSIAGTPSTVWLADHRVGGCSSR